MAKSALMNNIKEFLGNVAIDIVRAAPRAPIFIHYVNCVAMPNVMDNGLRAPKKKSTNKVCRIHIAELPCLCNSDSMIIWKRE
jgi:hypothetical protein